MSEELQNEEVVAEVEATEEVAEEKAPAKRPAKGDKNKKFDKKSARPVRKEKEYQERVVTIKRISKTVKGGRRMRFSALIVIGDGKGTVGYGLGKAAEVPDAIKKGLEAAKKNTCKVPMVKPDTLPHEIMGEYGAAKVFLRPAPDGTGIIAGGPVRAVLELAGIKNIYSKVYGSRVAINVVRATIDGINRSTTASKVAALRGKSVKDILA